MNLLTWLEKMLIQKMMIETLERAFNQEMAQEIYRAYSEAVFHKVENSEWFQDDEDIVVEHIEEILGALMIDAAKSKFEGRFEK